MINVTLNDVQVVEYIARIEKGLPDAVGALELMLEKSLAAAFQGDILEGILSMHPYHEFMAERTKVVVKLVGSFIQIMVEGKTEGELEGSIKKGKSHHNIWNTIETGGSTGSASVEPPKRMPIYKGINQSERRMAGGAADSYVTSTGVRHLNNTRNTEGLVGRIVEGLRAQFLLSMEQITDSLANEYIAYGLEVRGAPELQFLRENRVLPTKLLSQGVSGVSSRLIKTTDSTSLYKVTAYEAGAHQFVSLGLSSKMTVQITR